MISGDQMLFEAIIRSLPARRRVDAQLRAIEAMAPAVRALGEAYARAARVAVEAMRACAPALAAAVRAERDHRER